MTGLHPLENDIKLICKRKNKYRRYEEQKKKLQGRNLTPEAYESEIRRICCKLKI